MGFVLLSQSQKILTQITQKGERREFFIKLCENSPNLRFSRYALLQI